MTQLASDNYTRSNQSGWGLASDGTNTWSLIRGNSTFAISSNTGTVTNNSTSYCVERCGAVTSSNFDITIVFTRSNTADVSGVTARIGDANNWYSANIGEFTNNLVISKNVGGSYSDLAFGGSATYATGTTWAIRFAGNGTALQAKIWDHSTSEPGAWTVTTTDSSLASGGVGVVVDPFTSSPVTFTSFNATDGATSTAATKSVGMRLLVAIANSKPVGARLRQAINSTKSVPSRLRLAINKTRYVGTRLLQAINARRSVGARLRQAISSSKSVGARLRQSLNSTRSEPLRFRQAIGSNHAVSARLRQGLPRTQSTGVRLRKANAVT